ncbi:MAG: flagellar hook-basal body protein [Spirochaetales bacterium]|nr:flagellar hook-basal body protein [Leptospiraceae bacterium]MCP5481012.1 flagellar hook-basal body protein [Spirochaetales bacterium]MCP5485392.1 flagellar hook-basal body protein [Spirochaetales bacterium]
MLRGMYTGATGMIMNQHRMDVVANNLANVDKTGFKSDEAIFNAFPEMLIQRTRENGLGWVPPGSFDMAPIVGNLGMGVEFQESFTRFEQGAVKTTDNPFDFMLQDRTQERPAFFVVLTDRGERLTRSGSFILDSAGRLVTPDGFPLMGENGPIQIARHNVQVRENGEVWINARIGNEADAPANEYSERTGDWILLDKIQLRTVEFPRELKKEGNSFYTVTPESGPMRPFSDFPGEDEPIVLRGALEASNVNVVRAMVDMIEVQRQYEANQKSVTTHDQLLGKLINEVAR